MKLYKLTGQNYRTQNNTLWDIDITHTIESKNPNPQLCSKDVIHAYRDKNLALIFNAIHADIPLPILWEAEGDIVVEDPTKVGCYSLTTKKVIPIPEWYQDKKIKEKVSIQFAIYCAEAVLHLFEKKYDDKRPRAAIKAAKKYLKNPTDAADAAAGAADAADAAAGAADAAAGAADAAYAAAHAADAAAYAASAVRAADAVRAAAYAAAYAADAAAHAASAASAANNKINLSKLLKKAIKKHENCDIK